MCLLPSRFTTVTLSFALLFLQGIWRHAEVLLTGAILEPGQRTMASILHIMGLKRERRFVNYHRVLDRTAWCPRAASHILLGLQVTAFAPRGPLVLGIDDTIERRRGKRIAAKGIYRDPVRSSHGNFVKASGLRWLSLMRLATLFEILTDPKPLWKHITVPGWYSGERDIEVSTDTAVWRHGGMPVVPIWWAKQPKVSRAQRVERLRRASSATP